MTSEIAVRGAHPAGSHPDSLPELLVLPRLRSL